MERGERDVDLDGRRRLVAKTQAMVDAQIVKAGGRVGVLEVVDIDRRRGTITLQDENGPFVISTDVPVNKINEVWVEHRLKVAKAKSEQRSQATTNEEIDKQARVIVNELAALMKKEGRQFPPQDAKPRPRPASPPAVPVLIIPQAAATPAQTTETKTDHAASSEQVPARLLAMSLSAVCVLMGAVVDQPKVVLAGIGLYLLDSVVGLYQVFMDSLKCRAGELPGPYPKPGALDDAAAWICDALPIVCAGLGLVYNVVIDGNEFTPNWFYMSGAFLFVCRVVTFYVVVFVLSAVGNLPLNTRRDGGPLLPRGWTEYVKAKKKK